MIGKPEGSEFRTEQRGGVYMALRPTLGDYILTMKRGPTPIYPKDIGAILTYADIRPGNRVVESGHRLRRIDYCLVASRRRKSGKRPTPTTRGTISPDSPSATSPPSCRANCPTA